MKKEFVTYEQALALKELGFDELCLFYYGDNEIFRMYNQSEIEEDLIGAPLYQQAFRWFREKYDLQYTITWNKHYPKTPYEWEVRKSWRDEPLRPYGIGGMSATYQEAESACLDKLIEIVKTNE